LGLLLEANALLALRRAWPKIARPLENLWHSPLPTTDGPDRERWAARDGIQEISDERKLHLFFAAAVGLFPQNAGD